jgi:ADP-ribose pyrophosphatase YjhB (NUDIX family)
MPTLGVNVAIIHDGQVLLILRSDFPVWCLPGGAVDDGESLAQAAVREAREETGVDVALTCLVGVYSRPNWRYGGDHAILFAARPVGGRLQSETDETSDARYFDPADLPEALLWPHHQRILDVFSGAVGVAWLQDAVWPLGEDVVTARAARQAIERGDVSMQELVEHFCGRRRPERERREVDGR